MMMETTTTKLSDFRYPYDNVSYYMPKHLFA